MNYNVAVINSKPHLVRKWKTSLLFASMAILMHPGFLLFCYTISTLSTCSKNLHIKKNEFHFSEVHERMNTMSSVKSSHDTFGCHAQV